MHYFVRVTTSKVSAKMRCLCQFSTFMGLQTYNSLLQHKTQSSVSDTRITDFGSFRIISEEDIHDPSVHVNSIQIRVSVRTIP